MFINPMLLQTASGRFSNSEFNLRSTDIVLYMQLKPERYDYIVPHVKGAGEALFRQIEARGMEGVCCKA
ncbi:ATP-dependent DNA ligase [compost metagenome]